MKLLACFDHMLKVGHLGFGAHLLWHKSASRGFQAAECGARAHRIYEKHMTGNHSNSLVQQLASTINVALLWSMQLISMLLYYHSFRIGEASP